MKRLVELLVTLLMIPMGHTLIAYDCETPTMNVTAVSLRSIAPCQRDASNFVSQALSVQVVQRPEVRRQPVKTCLVEVYRQMFYCGMHSHVSAVSGGLSSYIFKMGAEACASAHRTQTTRIYNIHVGRLEKNATTSIDATLFGKIDPDGACQGTVFTENGRTWENVIVQATIKISLKEYDAVVRMETNEIVVSGGVACSYLRGYCMDSLAGESVWEVEPKEECSHVIILYEGTAEKVMDSTTRQHYLVVEQEDKVFAVTLVKKSAACDRVIWVTEHPRLLVLEVGRAPVFRGSKTVPANEINLVTYINSKFLYVEATHKRAVEKLYVDTLFRRCELHREVLRNRLWMAAANPSSIGELLTNERGYVGRVLGEVIYLVQCTPRPVSLRRTDQCYHELPIAVSNETKFISPLHHIIQSHAEEVDCSSLFPPMYYISDQWVGMAPHPIVRTPPITLSVDPQPRLSFEPVKPLGSGGIYTQEEVAKSQKAIIFGQERKAVETILIRKLVGGETDNQGLTSISIFDGAELKKLAQSTLYHMWGWFTDFGLVISGVMGFYVVFRMIKYILGVAINSWQIYQVVGCGVSVLAGVWNTLALWVVHENLRKQDRKPSDEEADTPKNCCPEPREASPKVLTERPVPHQREVHDTQPRGTANKQPNVSVVDLYPKLTHWTDENRQK